MQRIIALSIAALLVVGFSSCKTAEKYRKNNEAGQEWLAQHTASPRLDLSGSWQSADWGPATFYQTGRKVTGTLGGFQVEGVVSGSNAYLLLSEDGWVYYTVRLGSAGTGRLSGYYSYSVPFTDKDQQVILLSKF